MGREMVRNERGGERWGMVRSAERKEGEEKLRKGREQGGDTPPGSCYIPP